jgi:hypothetical protein
VRALVGTIDATIRATPTAALGGPASARALADAIANVQAALTPAGTGSRAVAGRQLGRVAGTLAAGFRTRSIDRDVGLRLLDLARAARTRLRAL